MSSINAVPGSALEFTALIKSGDNSSTLCFQTNGSNAVVIGSDQTVNCSSNTAVLIPSGTTAQRPGSPVNGMIRYNTNSFSVEAYANGAWSNITPTLLPVNSVAPVVSGSPALNSTLSVTTGTWSNTPTGYYYQWLANSVAISANATANTFVLTATQVGANISCNVAAYNAYGNASAVTSNSVGPVAATYTASYLLVAGGGGGSTICGGGGAGGMLSNTTTINPGTVYTATVGGGGAPNASGSNTTFTGATTAIGGGYGGNDVAAGGNGGSGGGGPRSRYGITAGGSGTAGQGNNGGSGNFGGGQDGQGVGGGGGGAGAAGGAASGGQAGSGGAGASSSITGTATNYAGGGGGGAYNTGTNSSGGVGGGGNGNNSNATAGSGTPNTGGGGGAAGLNAGGAGTSGSGGSGVVILSVPTSRYSGTTTGSPTITTSGSNTIIKFTASGTYTG